ncbi:MAG: hypothetical protein K8S99_11920 [Planctomycetes bacterium]|nr:hypothetical protein [Planctomycetota bacterium]
MKSVRTGAGTAVGLLLLAVAGVAGCEKPLFPEDLPRSPYDRYMTLRGQRPPMNETGPTGSEQPALRERLKPMGRD